LLIEAFGKIDGPVHGFLPLLSSFPRFGPEG
jgi:hypothetical protein